MASDLALDRSLGGVRRAGQILGASYRLGWHIESNWTRPFLFFTYALAKPLASIMILVAMFVAVGNDRARASLDFFVIGCAFWPFVLAGMQGMGASFIKDREQWRTLRDVYTSPMPFSMYLTGRALAQSTAACAACVVTLLFGRVVLDVPISLAGLPYATVAFLLGIAGVLALGLLIAASMLAMSSHAIKLPEAVAGALYLVSGVIFPVSVLPGPVQDVGMVMPLSWWLTAMRRGLLPDAATPAFAGWSDATLLAGLAALVIAWGAVGIGVFRWAEQRARRAGVLDRDSAF